MQSNMLFCLLSLSCLWLAMAQVSYDDCCLKYVKALSIRMQRNVVKYRRQVTDGGCNLPAIILIMRKGREFCTNPGHKWVKELMKKVDKKAVKHAQITQNAQWPNRG